jgi:RNA polymerase subunit RPABC4/transcription elongation factor Spt4
MSPKLPIGCLTVTLRKWGDSVIIYDEDGDQIAQIFAQVQNSEINDRIRVSIRAEQKYRIVRHKDNL